MKIDLRQTQSHQGNTLLVCVIFTVVLGISLAGVFRYTASQVTAVARSQSWNEALVLADAGIEEALQLVNKYANTTTSPYNWTSTYAADGWEKIAGVPVYTVTRNLGNNNYTAYITNSGSAPAVYSEGCRAWQATGLSSSKRKVYVTTAKSSLFQGAFLAKNGIVLNGTIRIDSFDSTNPAYSTNGQYLKALAKDGGDIGTISSNVVNAVAVGGSVDVFGEIYTGPGDTIKLTGGAQVGSLAWINGGNTGIQTNWSHSDLNVSIPDAPTQPSGGTILPSKTSNVFEGITYPNSYYLNAGNWQSTGSLNMNSSDTILISGKVNLYLPGSLKMTGSSQIVIGTNSSLTIFAAADLALGGNGVANRTGYATNLTVYGLNTSTAIDYTGNTAFVGTLYAPYANVKLSGGGYMVGSVVGNSITTSGTYEVHYDESLVQQSAGPAFYVTSWREL